MWAKNLWVLVFNEISTETESRHLQAFIVTCKNYSVTVASYNKDEALF